jgi:hypothetical protein
MERAKRAVRLVAAGAGLGALFVGLGGRGAMRLLALRMGNEGVFSLGGSAEVVLYGTIVGAAGGAAVALLEPWLRPRPWLVAGPLFGLALYAGTAFTLPAHIADTARPFAQIMPLVWLLFGLCFLGWAWPWVGLPARLDFRLHFRHGRPHPGLWA